jgi:uncharacterized integral membrane protein
MSRIYPYLADCLLWVLIPINCIAWIEVTHPLWQQLPPIGLIFFSLVWVGIIAGFAVALIPRNSHRIKFIGYALSFSVGLTLSLVTSLGG